MQKDVLKEMYQGRAFRKLESWRTTPQTRLQKSAV